MQLIGLAGPARSGKDTVANHLVKAHGFTKFSFADALYEEVSEAFRVSVGFLQDPRIKDADVPELALKHCRDEKFVEVARVARWGMKGPAFRGTARSPRFILQTWGTEYRRAQDPDYWIRRADEWLDVRISWSGAGEPTRFVNTSIRDPNEAWWLRWTGGRVWHVSRPNAPVVRAHSSEVPVPFQQGDQRIVNGGAIEQLWTAATILLSHPSMGEINVEAPELTGA